MMQPYSEGSELSRATAALDALPFCSIVETYPESLNRLKTWLKEEDFTDIELNNLRQSRRLI
jgi:hypothetical protein